MKNEKCNINTELYSLFGPDKPNSLESGFIKSITDALLDQYVEDAMKVQVILD